MLFWDICANSSCKINTKKKLYVGFEVSPNILLLSKNSIAILFWKNFLEKSQI